jgi:hypothetical protein
MGQLVPPLRRGILVFRLSFSCSLGPVPYVVTAEAGDWGCCLAHNPWPGVLTPHEAALNHCTRNALSNSLFHPRALDTHALYAEVFPSSARPAVGAVQDESPVETHRLKAPGWFQPLSL